MQSSKFVGKCGNFAVLVDLHILPLGGQNNASWFSPEHRKEVGSLIRGALELRVRQFQEARYQKIQPKPRKDLTLTAPLCLEGGNVHLAVHFMKRHINLRCIVRQHYRELRVFPERVVVCASPLENSALPNGNLNLDVSEPSHSKYFSSSVETTDPLPSSTATKRAILQKIARQASIQPQQRQDDQESKSAQFQADNAEKGSAETCHPVTISSGSLLTGESLEEGKAVLSSKLSNSKEVTEPHLDTTGPRRRPRTPSSSGEHADRQKTKISLLGEPAASSDSNNPSSDIAAPDSVCNPQPEISQTNQSGLAASLKGLSVKPVSSGSSISSRSVAREGKKGGESRTSRLRRLK
ncbi:protein SLX4IP [Sinocyclocheilus rhinocerous]|uniref:protein SLX4IP n=1 Tax=Sinocyclocheilus rhinocerous TaxID=307959 RepID=UPI0007BA3C7D|nr:PREDICTED: protein SLX4IP-like [Sinocyclocheilus rhinocerous]